MTNNGRPETKCDRDGTCRAEPLCPRFDACTADTEAEPATDLSGVVGVPADPNPGPVPIMAGTFAIYEDGNGGYVLVTETAAGGVDRKHIPPAIVKMATGGGIFGRKLQSLFGG